MCGHAGWDYRHWDAMLTVLASATVASLEEQQAMGTAFLLSSAEGAAGAATATAAIAAGWAAVFESGSHEILEVRAEGKHLEALKLLLTTNSVVSLHPRCPLLQNPTLPVHACCLVSLGPRPLRRHERFIAAFLAVLQACWVHIRHP